MIEKPFYIWMQDKGIGSMAIGYKTSAGDLIATGFINQRTVKARLSPELFERAKAATRNNPVAFKLISFDK